MLTRLSAAIAFLCAASCLALGQDLRMEEVPPQGAIVGQQYLLALTATGGAAPYSWEVEGGDLPPGCRLTRHTGKIIGVPNAPGDYHFTVVVRDSNIPQMQVQRAITIRVIQGLTIDWKEPPHVQGNQIRGSAVISNQTPHEVVVTLIVVAVNEIGRATALGYQHFRIAAGASSPIIPFGSGPGLGTYYVRADVVAHWAGHHGHIYRISKQESGLKVTQL